MWEATTIGELLEFKNGLNKDKEFFGKGVLIVNYMDVYRHRGIRAEQLRGRVTLSAEEIKRFDVRKGDVFFTRTSETPEEVGYAAVMLDEIDDCVFSGFVLRGRPITDELDIGYCQYAFMTEEIRKAIMSGCTYTTRALTNGRQLSAIEIPLPAKEEQRRIAEALSDTDALITAMEKLIAKKRAIKQAAMQELLTGKRRLPGFDGEWVEKLIGECGVFQSGNGFPLVYQGGHTGYPFYKVSDFNNEGNGQVMQRANNYITSQIANTLNCNIFPKTAIIFAKIGAAIFLERKRMVATECCIDNNMMAFIVDETVGYAPYFCYLFQTICFGNLVTATALPSLSAKSIGGTARMFPPTKVEQEAISTILSDMDAEIDVLTAKLNKLRNIKQGMMSELLTGRIRLMDSQTAESVAEVYPEMKSKPIRQIAEHSAAKGHSHQFDDAVMIAGIVNALYSDKYPLGRKKLQKCLYLLRRHQDESTEAFKKKAAGPYADEVRYKGGEPIARNAKYIETATIKGKGTTFARGADIGKALDYIHSWDKQVDIQWVTDKLKFKKVDELELLATVDMAICDLKAEGTPVSVQSIKHLIATNTEWKAKLKKQTFSDDNIVRAINELSTLLQGGN